MTYAIRDMPGQVAPGLITKHATVKTATVGHRRHMRFMDGADQREFGIRAAAPRSSLRPGRRGRMRAASG